MRIVSVGCAFPPHYVDQETLIAAFRAAWATRHHNLARVEQLHRSVLVGGRHLALPMDRYLTLRDFGDANDAFIQVGTDVGAAALLDALAPLGLAPTDIDALWFTSVTGVAAPTIDARIVNRLRLRGDLKRTPIFGLGCVAGAAGVARVADYLRGHPDDIAVLLSIELCSLTLQRDDLSIPNLIASGLFGDGAACVVLAGERRAERLGLTGPRVVASQSAFYPDTEDVMGWRIGATGFKIVLSAEVPEMVRRHLVGDVDRFLGGLGLGTADIDTWVAHPGGPRVLEVMEEAFGLPRAALARTWDGLRRVGNLSSASVLLVLRETLAEPHPVGSKGLMLAMGPGFCSELVLLGW